MKLIVAPRSEQCVQDAEKDRDRERGRERLIAGQIQNTLESHRIREGARCLPSAWTAKGILPYLTLKMEPRLCLLSESGNDKTRLLLKCKD